MALFLHVGVALSRVTINKESSTLLIDRIGNDTLICLDLFSCAMPGVRGKGDKKGTWGVTRILGQTKIAITEC